MYRAYVNVFRPLKSARLTRTPPIHYLCRSRFLSSAPQKPVTDIQKKTPTIPTVYDTFPGIVQCYKFPYIVYVSWAAKLKLFAVPFVGFAVSLVSLLVEEGECTDEDLLKTLVSGGSIIFSQLLVSIPVYNFVGSIYVNPMNGQVILSYVNFFGGRVDERFYPGDLYIQTRKNYPLKYLDKVYIYLHSRKKKRTFKINITEGDMIDVELFTSVFGEIPESAC